jgi:two-component sensor histidine kinase
MEPRYTVFKGSGPSPYLNAAVYVVTCTLLLLLVRYLNAALDQLERERDRANHLFGELQHRTANVMQNVSALLRHGMAQVRHDPVSTEVLRTAKSRFEAMASIHRRLYEPRAQTVSNQSLLQSLCDDLLKALGSSAEVQVFAEDKPLEHRKMFSLCVLLTELVINSTKHAFSALPEGKIAVWLTERNGMFKLDYADNGPGLPPDFTMTGPSLGGRILSGLAAQLDGKLVPVASGPGARFELEFPA